ncbi:MAG TPA: NADH-quinone oxidoreductase subunit J [Oleiagrimonas sp.]|nr:NADH-quinone oxidoreductase subunit J [Oleiagrimonas sp.]
MSPQLLQLICFWFFAVIAVCGALMVISLRNTVHSVLSLVLTFFSVACLWILLQAEFLGIALVVVYVGAVMVLFLFVVMMLNIDEERLREGFVRYLPLGIVVAAVMLLEMLSLIGVRAMHHTTMGPDPAAVAGMANTAWLGTALYTHYLLPFEIAALILTLGLVAAVVLTLRFREGTRKQNPGDQSRVKAADRVRVIKMDVERPQSGEPQEPQS